MKNKQIEIKDLLVASLDEKKTLDSINRQLVYIKEKIEPIKISVAVDGGTIDLGQVHIAFQNITDIAQNTSNEIISIIENAVQKMGILQTQMTNLQQMQGEQGESFSVNEYSSIIDIMVNLGTVILSVVRNWKALKNIVTIVRNGLSALTGPVGLVGSLLGTFAIDWGIKEISESIERQQYRQEMERQNANIVGSYTKHTQAIGELVGAYERLNKLGSGRSLEQEQEYLDIQNQLYQIMPEMIAYTDEQGNARLRSAQAVKQEYEYAKKLKELYDQSTIDNFSNEVEKNFAEITEKQKRIEKIQKEIKRINNPVPTPITEITSIGDADPLKLKKEQFALERDINIHYEKNAILLKDQLAARLNLSTVGQHLNQQEREYLNSIIDKNAGMLETQEDVESYANKIESLGKTMATLSVIMGDGFDIDVFAKIAENQDSLDRLTNSLSLFQAGSRPVGMFVEDLRKLEFSLADVNKAVDSMVNSGFAHGIGSMFNRQRYEVAITAEGYDRLSYEAQKLERETKSLNSQISTTAEEMDFLNQVQAEAQSEGGLTEKTLTTLKNKYGDVITKLGLNDQSLVDLITTSKDWRSKFIDDQRVATSETISGVRERIKAYLLEAEALNQEPELPVSMTDAEKSRKLYAHYRSDPYARLVAKLQASLMLVEHMEETMLEGSQNDAETKKAEETNLLGNQYNPLPYKPPFVPYESDVYAKTIAKEDSDLRESESRMRSYIATSKEYRKELQDQIDILARKQTATAGKVVDIDKELDELEKKRQQTKENSEAMNDILRQIDELTKARQSLVSTGWDYKLTREDKEFEQKMSSYQELNGTLEQYEHNLSMVQMRQQQYEEGTAEFNQALLEENEIYTNKRQVLSEQIAILKNLLSIEEKHTTQYQEINKLLQQTQLEYERTGQSVAGYSQAMAKQQESITKQREAIADEMIDLLKKAMAKEKELRTKAIDLKLKQEQTAHEKQMKMLDDELNKYQEIVDARLQSIDRAESERDYTKELDKANEEKQQIQNQINIFSLDDSLESQAKVVELQEQLDQKIAEIEEMQHKRSIELRKQNLQDQANAFRKEIEATKRTQEDKFKITKDARDQEKANIERDYQDRLNNEAEFSTLRNEIVQKGIAGIEVQLQAYLENFKQHNKDVCKELDTDWRDLDNLIQSIVNASTKYSSMPEVVYPKPKGAATGEEAIANEKKLTDRAYVKSEIDRTKLVIEGMKKAGIQDRSVQEQYLKRLEDLWAMQSFATGGYTGHFSGAKIGILHEKELILNKADTVNMLSALSFTDRIVSKLKSWTLSERQDSHYMAQAGNPVYNINMSLSVDGDTTGGKTVFNQFMKELRLAGGAR